MGHSKGKPILCETWLGWIVNGPCRLNSVALMSNKIVCSFANVNTSADDDFDKIRSDLSRFSQPEEINKKFSQYSPEEKLSEEHFVKNTTRLLDGRFYVRISLQQNPSTLENSINKASYCLQSLERRLKGKPEFS